MDTSDTEYNCIICDRNVYIYKFINIYLSVYKNCLSLYHIKIVRFELKNRSKWQII